MQHLTPRQRRWRRMRRTVMGTIAIAVIGYATLIAVAGIAFPWLLAHPDKVRAFLSERLHRPVAFGQLAGDWTWSGPIFTLHDVEVGGTPEGRGFAIASAELAVDFYAWARPGKRFSEFRVVGIEVDATRGGDGIWRIARLGGGSVGGGERARELLDLASISLRAARVNLTDELRGMDLLLQRVDLDLVNDGSTRRLGGIAWIAEDSAPLRFACEGTGITALRCYAGGRDLEPRRWLAGVPLVGIDVVRGRADVDLWFTLHERLQDVRVELATHDLVLRGSETIALTEDTHVEPRARLPLQRLALDWTREQQGWRIDWLGWQDEDGEPDTRARIRYDDTPAGGYDIAADRIDLGPSATLLSLSTALPAKLRTFLFENSPRGRVSQVALRIDAQRNASGRLRLDDVSWRPGQNTPGIETLAGDVLADGGAYVLVPEPNLRLRIDYPHVFRQPIEALLARGTVGVFREPEGWRTELSDFAMTADVLKLRGSIGLLFDGNGRPGIDAVAVIDGGSVPRAKLFWPINSMPPKTVQWLDRGLVAGSIERGEMLAHGDLDDWPFKRNDGRFDARTDLADVDLIYNPDWPMAHLDRAVATFDGPGMAVSVDGGSVLGLRVAAAHGDIPTFRNASLQLHAEGDSGGAEVLRFLRESPVHDNIGSWLTGLKLEGDTEYTFDMGLPLHGEHREPDISGVVQLKDADIADTKWNMAFGNATGRVRYSEDGVAADDLAVTTEGEPATLSLLVGEFVADPRHLVEAALRGELSARTVFADFGGLDPLIARMPGRSDWTLDLTVDRTGGDAQDADEASTGAKRLVLHSSLQGTALDLPAPLRKDADSTLPLRVEMALPVTGAPLSLELGELAQFRARLPDATTPLAATMAFGGDDPGDLPASGLSVRGDVAALDAGGWLGLLGGGGSDAIGGLLDLDVRAADLALYSRHFADTRVKIATTAEATRVVLSGPAVSGTVTMPRGDGGGDLTAEFERLHLPDVDGDASDIAKSSFDPARIPTLHFWTRDLRFGKASLGEARIESVPVAGGMRIDRLETNSPDIQIRARGEWRNTGGVERSTLDVTFTADSLGRMLDALGFAGIVEGGQTMARIEGSWPGSPAQFGLARIDGTLEANVGRGRILDVDPGAGRILGLISLQAIPRRLALDFSDFFKSGMSFDSIAGKFELRAGDAFTTDLQVKGPSADIRVSGRTGIRARDYDQQLEVTPRVGGVLPVVGALAAGPAGAAAGLVVQGVLKRPMDSMVRARYRVTGSWDKPDIELIAKERGRAPPRDDAGDERG